MKLGIGAIPQNLIIKSGGYTYYPLNQFEIDGTVAIELYRQDSDGDKTRVFVFKGTKNELSEFKKRYPARTIKQSFYKAKRYPYESPEKGELERLTPAAIKRLYNKVDVDVDPIKRLHKLAESLSEEAANFNKKIKTDGTLTPNELRAAGKIIPKYNAKFNRNVITSAPKKSAERSKMVKSFIKENTLTKKELKSIKNTRDAKPAVKKVDFKITSYSGYFYVIHKNTGLRLINKSFRSYDDAMDSAKKLSFIATDGKPILYDTPIITKSLVVKKPAVKKPVAKKAAVTKGPAVSVYIEFLNKNKNFQKDIKRFKSYDEAVKYAKKTFDKFSPDMIKFGYPVVVKKAAVKKTTTKKSPLRQTGSSNTKFDKLVQAMKPGKRTSASGNVYYERRYNRTDKGKNL